MKVEMVLPSTLLIGGPDHGNLTRIDHDCKNDRANRVSEN